MAELLQHRVGNLQLNESAAAKASARSLRFSIFERAVVDLYSSLFAPIQDGDCAVRDSHLRRKRDCWSGVGPIKPVEK